MQANWPSPYPAVGLALDHGEERAYNLSASKGASSVPRRSARDRFDYRLIFAISFVVLVGVGLIERSNPLHWFSRHGSRRASLWEASKRGAHHCATIAFQG